jgi:nanoRNase/pAp phosphatase (c-di-AMP/oligoRNAs hydrolase)
MIGEVADLLLRDDNATCTISYGFGDKMIRLSIRTSDEKLEADKIMQNIVGKDGTGGGHKTYAGGQVPLNGLSKSAIEQLEQQLYKKFLKTLNLPEHPYSRLIQI